MTVWERINMADQKWLATCATAGEFLYGEYSVTTLKKLYERKKGYKITTEDLISGMQELEKSGMVLMTYETGKLDEDDDDLGFFLPTEVEGTPLEKVMKQLDAAGNPYASLHFSEEERLDLTADTPEDLDYYIPTEAEITELVEKGYIRTPAMKALEEQIRKRGGDPEYLKPLWGRISADKMDHIESIQTILSGIFPKKDLTDGEMHGEEQEERKAASATLDDLNGMMLYVNNFINNINLRSRKGWRPDELFRKTHPKGLTKMPTIVPGSVHAAKMLKEAEPRIREMGGNVDYSSIDSFVTTGAYGERKVIKVGRNDPCPCGSGKKYKQCHGRYH